MTTDKENQIHQPPPTTKEEPIIKAIKVTLAYLKKRLDGYQKDRHRKADARYFTRELLFRRLKSRAFHKLNRRKRKQEVERLERLYWRLQ